MHAHQASSMRPARRARGRGERRLPAVLGDSERRSVPSPALVARGRSQRALARSRRRRRARIDDVEERVDRTESGKRGDIASRCRARRRDASDFVVARARNARDGSSRHHVDFDVADRLSAPIQPLCMPWARNAPEIAFPTIKAKRAPAAAFLDVRLDSAAKLRCSPAASSRRPNA
jgi:hypothetical protein